jgi:hypothetical protein
MASNPVVIRDDKGIDENASWHCSENLRAALIRHESINLEAEERKAKN